MTTQNIRIFHIIKNNLDGIKSVFLIDPCFVLFTLFVNIINSLRNAFLYVYLLSTTIYFWENNYSTKHIILFLIGSIVFIALSFSISSYYNNIFKPIHREKISLYLQNSIFDSLRRADLINYDSEQLYTTISLAESEVETLPFSIIENVFNIFELVLTITIILAGSVFQDYLGIVVCSISFILGIFITKKNAVKLVEYDTKMKMKDKEINTIYRILYLPEFSKERRLTNIYDLLIEKYKSVVNEKQKIVHSEGKDISRNLTIKNIICSSICIDFLIPLLLSVKVLFWHTISIADFVMIINSCNQLQLKLESFTQATSCFIQNGNCFDRLKNVNFLINDIECTKGNINLEEFQTLTLEDVSFRYPNSNFQVYKINLKINKGQKIAIVGRNGSGKSTLVKLLLRLYDPISGSIYYNEHNIMNLDIDSYRSCFSSLLQDYQIYATSIKNNISMGEDINNKNINSALQKSELLGKINDVNATLTNEFDNLGIQYSGGILQRIALARVFYKNSDIIIMDEPTAAMDVSFERKFYDILHKQLKDKTVIFISHRLSSVTACDKIVYMEHGHITEEGTHDDLMKLKGNYYQLFKTQFEYTS